MCCMKSAASIPTSSSIYKTFISSKWRDPLIKLWLLMCHIKVHEVTSIISVCTIPQVYHRNKYTPVSSIHVLPMITDQSAPMCQKWLSLGSTHAQVLPPRHHHHCNSITPKCLMSMLHIKSLFQATPVHVLESMHPILHQSLWPQLLNASNPLNPPYVKSPKVTTSCHHELHESSPTNISASIQVSAQRSLQDASALHVVGMLHSLLTTPSKSMALLYKSAQPLHWLISKTSLCHTSKSICTTSLPWHSSLDAHKWHLYKCSCIMSLHKTAMLHVSNLMSMTQVAHVVQLGRPITTIGHPHPSLQSSV